MRRVACVWLPTWPTDRLRRTPDAPPPERPLILAVREGSRRLIYAADAAALALGLRSGLTVAVAQAMHPEVTVLEADPGADRSALQRLAVWALRYAPLVAADPPDGLVIDVEGAAHLHGGEEALVANIVERLARSGITARVAVADTWAAAWGLVRYGPPGTVVPRGELGAAVAGLPITALRLGGDLVLALAEAGIDTVADLTAVPRPSLALRFGSALTSALDRLHGHAPEILEPVLAPTLPHARLAFVDPLVHVTGLAMAIDRLAVMLCTELETAGLGARQLDLRLTRVDNAIIVLRVGASRSTRDPRHIARLFGERLDSVEAGFGIEAAVLAATRVEPLGAHQLEARDRDEGDEPDLAPLVDRIAGRIGGTNIYRLAVVESDIPERAVRAVPALAPATGRSWNDGPRPHRLISPPQPIDVVAFLPDHPPRLFIWNGRRHHVVQADGPESLFGEWWLSDEEVFHLRDYYTVEDTEGLRVWLLRATGPEGARWYVQGIFA